MGYKAPPLTGCAFARELAASRLRPSMASGCSVSCRGQHPGCANRLPCRRNAGASRCTQCTSLRPLVLPSERSWHRGPRRDRDRPAAPEQSSASCQRRRLIAAAGSHRAYHVAADAAVVEEPARPRRPDSCQPPGWRSACGGSLSVQGHWRLHTGPPGGPRKADESRHAGRQQRLRLKKLSCR